LEILAKSFGKNPEIFGEIQKTGVGTKFDKAHGNVLFQGLGFFTTQV
jgi:hypothetical protein